MNDTAYERIIRALQERGCKVIESHGGRQASAQCPQHEDTNPSFGVADRGDRALINCQAGCDNRDIVAALGLTMADLFNEPPTRSRPVRYEYGSGRVAKRWYGDDGKKQFAQDNTHQPPELFHADRVKASPGHLPVYLVEGEEDVLTLENDGRVATTAIQGAASFHKVHDVSALAGRNIVCVIDRDNAGQKWAQLVEHRLHGIARSLDFVHAALGKDTSDHYAHGLGVDDFVPLGQGADEAVVTLTAAGKIPMRAVKWTYQGRIPAGMITVLAGREGIGKSTVGVDVAARTTRGTLPGKHFGAPKPVVICATEDSWSHTIVPRLKAADADLDMVFHIAVRMEGGGTRAIIAPTDVARMERALRRNPPGLMVIDPLMAIIDGRIDTYKQAEVQQGLEPLVKLCERLDMAVLALIHVNKSGSGDPLDSIMGSKAFATIPRSVLYCLEEDDGQFMFCHAKCNVGPKMPSVGYRLLPVSFDLDDGDTVTTSRVQWGDEDARTAAQVLAEKQTKAHIGEAAGAVLQVINGEMGAITTTRLKSKLEQYDDRQIENALTRLTNKGQIVRVHRGTYQSLSVTPSGPNTHLPY